MNTKIGLTKEELNLLKKDKNYLKICSKCGCHRDIKKFTYAKSKINDLYYASNTCGICLYKKRKIIHGDMFTEYNRRLKDRLVYTLEGRASLLLSRCKNNARRYKFIFSLKKEDLLSRLEIGKCERTNIPFHIGELEFHPYAPSVDRIDCSKGYTSDNIQLVCMIYNLAKNKFGDEAVTNFVKDTIKYSVI